MREIFPAKVGFSGHPQIPGVLGAGGNSGGELAKVDSTVGWAGSSPDCQGIGQGLSLDLSPGPPGLWVSS